LAAGVMLVEGVVEYGVGLCFSNELLVVVGVMFDEDKEEREGS